jgi:BirA family transcriptional regulator, biotin operon repressor / biotin---[acetyl-CoA-carboxylase] ligase
MNADDLLLPQRKNVRVLAVTGSTNADARLWAEEGAPEGSTLVADTQTAGRGRLERSWLSPPGMNLYLSQIIRGSMEELRLVPMVGAVAVRETVSHTLKGMAAVIKWPNDILVSEMKVAGILVEAARRGDPAAILGIGVNLNMSESDFPTGLRTPAASLRMLLGHPLDRRAFLEQLLDRLEDWRNRFRTSPGDMLNAVRTHCITINSRVRISSPGHPPWIGLATDIREDGTLLVTTDAGTTVCVEAGDVDSLQSHS